MLTNKYISEFNGFLVHLAELPVLLKIRIFEHIQTELLFIYSDLAAEIDKELKYENIVDIRNSELSSSTKDGTLLREDETIRELWETSVISSIHSRHKTWSEKISPRKRSSCIRKKMKKTSIAKCRVDTKTKRGRKNKILECAVCSNQFAMKNDLIKHMKSHTNRTFDCNLCDKKFSVQAVLKNHISVIHQRVNRFYCNKCQYFSYSAHTLKEHVRMKHEERYKKYACTICKMVLPSPYTLKVHLRSHTGEKPYKCDSCDASFICSGHLTNHKNAIHKEERYTCDVCSKSFQTIHRLKRHTLIHSAIKPFNCPLCDGYSANTHGNLTRHIRTVHQMVNFSYLKYKKMLNGEEDSTEENNDNWAKNAEPVIRQYLEELSSKVGYNITINQLKEKYDKSQKTKKLSGV